MIGRILLIILLLLILLSFVLRLGVLAGYGRDGFLVKLRIGPGWLQLVPRKKKDPKKAEEKKKKKEEKKAKKAAKIEKKAEKKPPKPKKKLDLKGALAMGRDLLPALSEAGNKFGKKLQIDRLDLDLTWAAEDPADAAIRYGRAWAAAESLLAFLENCFVIRERRVTINLDFYGEKPKLYFLAGFSLTLAQLTAIGVVAAVKGLRIFLAHRKTLFKKTAPAAAGGSDTVKGELNHG